MSTDIRNGYLLSGEWSLARAQRVGRAVQKRVVAWNERRFQSLFCRDAAQMIDAYSLGKIPNLVTVLHSAGMDDFVDSWQKSVAPISSFVSLAHNRLMNQDSNGRFVPREYNLNCQICFLPAGRKTLAMVFTHHREHLSIWESASGGQPFDYWDHSDKPDNVSDRDWQRRRDLWDKAFPGLGIPKLDGLMFEATGMFAYYASDGGAVPNLFPAKADRVAPFAQAVTIEGFIRKLQAEAKAERKTIHGSAMFYMAGAKWIKTRDGQRAVRQSAKEIAAKLANRITSEMVNSTPAAMPPRVAAAFAKRFGKQK